MYVLRIPPIYDAQRSLFHLPILILPNFRIKEHTKTQKLSPSVFLYNSPTSTSFHFFFKAIPCCCRRQRLARFCINFSLSYMLFNIFFICSRACGRNCQWSKRFDKLSISEYPWSISSLYFGSSPHYNPYTNEEYAFMRWIFIIIAPRRCFVVVEKWINHYHIIYRIFTKRSFA